MCKKIVFSFRIPISAGVFLVLLLAAILCACSVVPAEASQEGNKGSEPCANQTVPPELGFADALFAEQDYYRAVTEYKRFVYLYPRHPEVERAHLNMARGAIAAKRWDDARSILQHILEQNPQEDIRARAHVLLAEIPYLQDRFDLSLAYVQQIEGLQLDPAFTQRVKELELWSMLRLERLEDARAFLNTQELNLQPNLEDIVHLQELARKSPRLAGTLSALLPGAGQLYNGRYREAGMAFALNAAFIAGGLQAINTGNTVLGGILLFFEAGWYGGNIYNAVNTAHKTNRRRYHKRLEQLRGRCQFSLLSAERGPMLQLRTRF